MFKSRGTRPKDEHDFPMTTGLLEPEARKWLVSSLPPGHTWREPGRVQAARGAWEADRPSQTSDGSLSQAAAAISSPVSGRVMLGNAAAGSNCLTVIRQWWRQPMSLLKRLRRAEVWRSPCSRRWA